jgi:hypothetical protein
LEESRHRLIRKFIKDSFFFILHDFRNAPNEGSRTPKFPSAEAYWRLPIGTLVALGALDSLLRE